MLDSRAPPPPGGYAEEESQRDEEVAKEIERLQQETRLWRVANSAQWVAWGIVQAKVPGLDDAIEAVRNKTPTSAATPPSKKAGDQQASVGSDPVSPEVEPLAAATHDKRPEGGEAAAPASEEEGEGEEEFDYLGYAQQRALFFWGDVLQLGLVKKEDLPAEMLERVKVVEY